MKKLLLVVLSLSLILSACMPAFLEPSAKPTQSINAKATIAALGSASLLTQTLEILPTSTVASTNTTTPTVTKTNTPIPPTETTAPTTLTTGTVMTSMPGTAGPGTPTVTYTPVTFTATLGVLTYGTLPPLVPSGKLLLMNKSHAQAYISLQCLNKEGTISIMEFPVGKWTEVKIASGKCDYVAWVGGRQFTGKFSLDTGGQKTITLYNNRIKIK
jgi:hypothetical protein